MSASFPPAAFVGPEQAMADAQALGGGGATDTPQAADLVDGGEVRHARVLAIDNVSTNGTLRCELLDNAGELAGVEVAVHVPPKLEHDAAQYPAVTSLTTNNEQQVEVTDGTNTETWAITPRYVVGDALLVWRGSASTVSIDAPRWVDLNRDGRAWAEQAP